MSTAFQLALQHRIERHLNAIEGIIGPGYRITLCCRYTPKDGLDKDIVMTLDDSEKAISTIRKMMKRPSVGAEVCN